jgi:beta-methylmalyl-CoA/(S)-malyl-CoA lyase
MSRPTDEDVPEPMVEIEPSSDERRLCRSFLTAPVAVPNDDTAKYLRSGFTRDGFETPDWLVPDLEDGIAPDMREEGVENVIELVGEYTPSFSGTVWPRIRWSYDDERRRAAGEDQMRRIAREIGDHVTGFIIPKVGRIDDVSEAERAVADAESEAGYAPGSFEMAPIIETAAAKEDLSTIARFGRNSRLHGLVFGPVDYTAELGGRKIDGRRTTWRGVVEDLSNATSANGLVAIGGPFDQIFHERAGVTVYNADMYADHAEREARLGLDGSWALHPKQTVQANTVHTPTVDEVERDVENLEAYIDAKADGVGAILIDGQMVDEGTIREYRNTVETVVAVDDRHPEQTSERYPNSLVDRAVALADQLG